MPTLANRLRADLVMLMVDALLVMLSFAAALLLSAAPLHAEGDLQLKRPGRVYLDDVVPSSDGGADVAALIAAIEEEGYRAKAG